MELIDPRAFATLAAVLFILCCLDLWSDNQNGPDCPA